MGACECYDAVPFDILKSVARKARKSWCCYECGKFINPGDQYHYLAGKCEGELVVHRTCQFYRNVLEDLSSMGYCVLFGGLWELVGEIERGDE